MVTLASIIRQMAFEKVGRHFHALLSFVLRFI